MTNDCSGRMRADAGKAAKTARRLAAAAQSLSVIVEAPRNTPFVVAQLGQSLDGRIATRTGESRWINGDPALDHVHRVRAHVDAVVVGIGTVLADDPLLTVRRVEGPNPARVVIDANGRLPSIAHCLIDDGARRVVICREGGGHRAAGIPGVEIVELPAVDGMLCPLEMARGLFRIGLKTMLIEGGARTVSQFIQAGAVDRLHVLVAPVILGSGKTGLDLTPIDALADARRPDTQAYVLDDGEVLFDCKLR